MSEVITFDFDSTLTTPEADEDGIWWDTINPNHSMLALMREIATNAVVKIVTSRNTSKLPEVLQFVKTHNLPVSECIATDGEDKAKTLRDLNSVKHFDDDQWELDQIKAHCPNCQPIQVMPIPVKLDEQRTI